MVRAHSEMVVHVHILERAQNALVVLINFRAQKEHKMPNLRLLKDYSRKMIGTHSE